MKENPAAQGAIALVKVKLNEELVTTVYTWLLNLDEIEITHHETQVHLAPKGKIVCTG